MGELGEYEQGRIKSVIEQITKEGREGSLSELQDRIIYISHVKNNPTKSMPEAIDYLYQEVDNLGAYVTNSVTNEDIDFIKSVHSDLIARQLIAQDSQGRAGMMLDRISSKNDKGETPQGYGICLALAPDNSRLLITEIPKRESRA